MERSKIPMLSRFDAISHIMPYYGQTHWAFLLLLGLCSETRCKLDEFYDEFVAHMKENWWYIKVDKRSKWGCLFLPNDLFQIYLNFWEKEMTAKFIKFIKNLRDSKGWYFNSHHMHSKIKIRDRIRINFDFIRKLIPYVDVLKSTQVIFCKEDFHTSKIQYELSTLDTNCSHALLIFKRTYINVRYLYKI